MSAPLTSHHKGHAPQRALEAGGEFRRSAVGENSRPTEAKRSDGNGVGCHYYGLKAYWLSAPDFTPTAHLSSARVVCGCLQ